MTIERILCVSVYGVYDGRNMNREACSYPEYMSILMRTNL
jgi:hypothetical protein